MVNDRLSTRLPIPIATSALLQLHSILPLLPAKKSVGILTFDGTQLGDKHLTQIGLSQEAIRRTIIKGPPSSGHLHRLIKQNAPYSHSDIENELVQTARQLLKERPDVGAILLECTQMPPFADAIQRALQLPIYDVYTMGCWFYSGLVRERPHCWGP